MSIEKGQLSKIILSAIYDEDKYVNEIFEFINAFSKSDNKKVNLYSTLKKLEEQKLISSYWRENNVGAKRHYYSITDLGKKSIDKWGKLEYSQQINSNSNKEENTNINSNAIIVQPNLFEKESTTKSQNAELFVQYNLFENNLSITPPASNTCNLESTLQDINKSTSNTTRNFDSNISNNVKQDFIKNIDINKLYIEKSDNGSFTDSLKNVKFDNTTRFKRNISDDIAEDKEIPTELLPNVESSFDYTNKTIVNLDDVNIYQQTDSTKSTMQNIAISNNLDNDNLINNKRDDAVLITEKTDQSQVKKVKRIEPSRFDIYLSDYSISPYLDEKFKKVPFQDRIKELYEKSKQNVDNKDIKIQNNDISICNYEELENFYSQEGLEFYTYSKQPKKNQSNFIYINRLNLMSSSIFLILNLIICISSLLFVKKSLFSLPINKIMFYLVIALSIIQFFYYTYKFLIDKNKHIYNELSIKFANKLIISALLILIIFIVNLAFGLNIFNIFDCYFSFVFPSFVLSSYIITILAKKTLTKKFEI